MPLDKLTVFTKKVQDLADKPNGTMTASEVKAQFDAAPEELRVYLNQLIDDLSSVVDGDSGADNIKATSIAGLTGTTVQAILEALKTLDDTNRAYLLDQINGVVLGQIPDGTITLQKLAFAIASTATDVSLTDTGAYYTGTNVETALQEVGQVLNSMRGDLITSANAVLGG